MAVPLDGRALDLCHLGFGFFFEVSCPESEFYRACLVAQLVKNPPAMRETWVWSLGWEDPLEKGTATHSSILAWKIPWTVYCMGSQRVRHNWATFTQFYMWSRKSLNGLQFSGPAPSPSLQKACLLYCGLIGHKWVYFWAFYPVSLIYISFLH